MYKKKISPLGWALIIIGVAAVAFCITALIYGDCNNLTFVETMEEWFNVTKDVAESAPVVEDAVETASQLVA